MLNFPSIYTTTNTIVTGPRATGGNSVYTTCTGLFGNSYVHVFSGPGSFSITTASFAPLKVSFLAVAGGGGAGAPSGYTGGGGAGGMVTGTASLPAASTYIVTVGTGGSGGFPSPNNPSSGGCGSPSSISGYSMNIVAVGGGGGGGSSAGGATLNGNPGGSGGGSPVGASPGNQIFPNHGGAAVQPLQPQTVPACGIYFNYGNFGGTSTGGLSSSGGGGAGGAGIGGSGSTPGVAGGPGRVSSITGSPITYAAGGRAKSGTGIAGACQTGNGGASGAPGGPFPGGPGIVVISYSSTYTSVTTTTYSATYTTPAGFTYTYNTGLATWILTNLPPRNDIMISDPLYVENMDDSSTGYFDLPSGTTAQRPANPQGGWIRFNTDIPSVEYYSTITGWTSLPFTT